jgi:hypothetical protein
MIFAVDASATAADPLRSSDASIKAELAQYRPTVRRSGSHTVDVVLHIEAGRLADALSDGINALTDALHANGDHVGAASVSGAEGDS